MIKGSSKVTTSKKVKRARNRIIEVNYNVIQFVNGILIKYDEILEDAEKDSFKNLEQHMINLNSELAKIL